MEQNFKSMGRWMWILAWLCLLGLLTLYFQDKLAQIYNPNQDPASVNQHGQVSIVLKQNRAGHYVASGLINDYPAVFLLDTGATQVSIPASLADEIGLVRGARQKANTANGVIDVYETRIKSLSIGGLTLYDLRATINPYMAGSTVLLGMNVLRHLKLVQQGNQLTITQ